MACNPQTQEAPPAQPIPEIDPYDEEELDELFKRLEQGDPPKQPAS
jgi:hypothetical protein